MRFKIEGLVREHETERTVSLHLQHTSSGNVLLRAHIDGTDGQCLLTMSPNGRVLFHKIFGPVATCFGVPDPDRGGFPQIDKA